MYIPTYIRYVYYISPVKLIFFFVGKNLNSFCKLAREYFRIEKPPSYASIHENLKQPLLWEHLDIWRKKTNGILKFSILITHKFNVHLICSPFLKISFS